MKYKESFSMIKIIIPLSLLILFDIRCFPDRVPTDPDYQVQDVRRPAVEHHVPLSDGGDIDRDSPIIVWFDELMDNSSVQSNFFLWPSVKLDLIQALAIDAVDPGIIYAAKTGEGIFISNNAAEHWQWLTLGTLKAKITDLVTAPGMSGFLYLSSSDNGIYKSTDGGSTWQQFNNGLPEMDILTLSVDPGDENIVYAVTRSSGIYKSEDGGESWIEKNNGIRLSRPPVDIAINPSDPNILYVATDGDFVFKSYDGGANWNRLQNGFLTRNFKEIIVHPQDTSLVYAISNSGGIYRTKVGGDAWELIIEGLPSLNIQTAAVHPMDKTQIIIAISSEIYKSVNMGETWVLAGTIDSGVEVAKIDIHSSEPNRVFAATNFGIYKSDDFGALWAKKSDLPLDDLYIEGSYSFELWQDSTTIITALDSTTMDTTIIVPYVYSRALASWIAGGKQGYPPVDDNPQATKMIFTPDVLLLPEMKYQARVKGTFENDRQTFQESFGVRDVGGNSMELNKNFTFTTKND